MSVEGKDLHISLPVAAVWLKHSKGVLYEILKVFFKLCIVKYWNGFCAVPVTGGFTLLESLREMDWLFWGEERVWTKHPLEKLLVVSRVVIYTWHLCDCHNCCYHSRKTKVNLLSQLYCICVSKSKGIFNTFLQKNYKYCPKWQPVADGRFLEVTAARSISVFSGGALAVTNKSIPNKH